jgi:tetratricopeptide (TPR) repeat protein
MKKLITCLFILLAGFRLSAQAAGDLDSLKQKLQVTKDSLKGPIYVEIANQYLLKNDTISSRRFRYYNQVEALNYTMLALHNFSNISDTLGLRACYNNLSKIYRQQYKYIQAKWFILQSNAISRQKKDVPNIITSLIELSAIKADMKDYKWAMRDLNEALTLSVKNKYPKNESAVQVGYAGLYRQMKDFDKAAVAIKRHEEIDDSVRQAEIDRLARITTQDSIQLKKRDSIIVKKKVLASSKKAPTSSKKKPSKTASVKRIASL